MTATWTFNGNYKDLAQVDPFIGYYTTRLNDILAAGMFPYNDSFKGHLGATFATSKDEDSAIYLCQGVKHLIATAHKVNEAWNAGLRPIAIHDLSNQPRKFERVIEFGWYMDGSGFADYTNVRLLEHHHTIVILRPRQRTNGSIVFGQVLAR